VSFQITVLKVLAGHPGGRLSVADLSRAVAILVSSGTDWTDRTKRLLARAPELDIFGQSLVIRDTQGWQITEAGRTLLAAIENPAASRSGEEAPKGTAAEKPMYSTSAPVVFLGLRRRRPRRSRRAVTGRPAA
jgi:hypothetical protein